MKLATRPISPRQLELLIQLANEHPRAKVYIDTQLAAWKVDHPSQLSSVAATNIITVTLDDLRSVPSKRSAEVRHVEVGMYRHETDIYRVYLGQQSGRNLVARLVRKEGDPKRDYEFAYVGLASAKLPQGAEPLPLDEAKHWGRMTGSCCVCAKRLDVPASVDAGIGPKCARSFR